MQEITIILGYKCNYSCSHCANNSGPNNTNNCLSTSEIDLIKNTLLKYSPKTITFVGGEPTLYIDEINEILNGYAALERTKIQIITNGWFAKNAVLLDTTIKSIRKLDVIFLSFDIFHGSLTKKENIKLASQYCINNNIQFELMMCISNPVELIQANKLTVDLPVKVNYQKVVKCGRAISNHKFFNYPSFETNTLNKKCPAEGKIVFLPGKGFSTCCSSLAFESYFAEVSNYDLETYTQSNFYQTMTNKTFAEMFEQYGVTLENLDPSDSLECNLCSNLFTRLNQKKRV